MKNLLFKTLFSFLSLVVLVLTCSTMALSRSSKGNELAYFGIPGLDTLSGSSVASGDYIPVYDASAAKVKKVDATTQTIATLSATTLGVSGAATLSGSITGDGGDALVGYKQSQVASTTTSATIAQCGSTFVSNSADVITLPEASTALGCRYTFVCGTADDFDINPADATDTIGPVSTTNGSTAVVTLAPSAGDAIRCTDIGGSITLEAIGANLWAQVGGGNGIWTDVN